MLKQTSLATRLSLWYALAFVSLLMVTLIISFMFTESILSQRMDEDLEEDIEELRLLFGAKGIDGVKEEIAREVSSDGEQDIFFRIYENENLLFTSDLSHWRGLVSDQEEIAKVISTGETVLETLDISSQDAETRAAYGRLGPHTVLHFGESLEEQEEIMDLVLAVFAVMFFVIVPIACTIGWFVARQATFGIKAVSRAAAEIEKGLLDPRGFCLSA